MTAAPNPGAPSPAPAVKMSRAGFPMPAGPVVNHPGLWRGSDFKSPADYVTPMSQVMIDDIDAAFRAAKARGLKAPEFEKEDFPLPNCAAEIGRVLDDLETGRGFALIRGFPMERYDEDDAGILFWGIGRHFGAAVSQNADGHLLGHVRNLDLDIKKTNVRGYQTTIELAHHNDQSDVIALMCRKTAKSGGESSLVSVASVHNAMLEQCPDLLAELFNPFYIDRRGELGRADEGDAPHYAMPILSYHNGLLTMRYIRGYIHSAQRFDDVPRLTDKQVAAMDAFDALARSPGMALDFTMEPGDIQMANNYCVLHSRRSFVDNDAVADRRHMLRIWLCVPNSRELPPCFERRFGTCAPGALRGGIPPHRQQSETLAQEFELARL